MKYLKLFEGRTPSSPFGNKSLCYKETRSRQTDPYYTEIIHIPGEDGDEAGLYIESQVTKENGDKIIIKCGTYKKDGISYVYTRYKG